MRTIPLRRLLREPLRVKHRTRAGEKVWVTDNGKSLWLIQAAPVEEEEQERARAIDEILDQRPPASRSKFNLSEILEQSRGLNK